VCSSCAMYKTRNRPILYKFMNSGKTKVNFLKNFRMSLKSFDELLYLLQEGICGLQTNMRRETRYDVKIRNHPVIILIRIYIWHVLKYQFRSGSFRCLEEDWEEITVKTEMSRNERYILHAKDRRNSNTIHIYMACKVLVTEGYKIITIYTQNYIHSLFYDLGQKSR
jgi:hypothetical protein